MTKAIKLPDEWYGDDYSHKTPFYINNINQILVEQINDDYFVEIITWDSPERDTPAYGFEWRCYRSINVATEKERQALFEQVIQAIHEAMTNEELTNDQ